MFTGIIEGMGTIVQIRRAGHGRRLEVASTFDLSGTRIGDSISVNGACLTVVEITRRRFSVDVSPETLRRTTLGRSAAGERVNLERALRLGDRLDGHLVSGHVDGTGVITGKRPEGNAVLVTVTVDPSLARYMITKGSVAVDGISLTINRCLDDRFDVSIIPHTGALTTIGFKKEGDAVNIETDMIGKYIERFVTRSADIPEPAEPRGGIDRALLMKNGFL